MDSIQLNIKHLAGIVSEEEILRKSELATSANRALHDGSREGSDFLGWVNLPLRLLKSVISKMLQLFFVHCEVVVIVGGSYLGARAVIDVYPRSTGCRKICKNPDCLQEIISVRLSVRNG